MQLELMQPLILLVLQELLLLNFITNAHTVTLAGGTAGSGSGSTVTGQFVSEVTIFD